MSTKDLSDETIKRVSDDIVYKIERYNRSLALAKTQQFDQKDTGSFRPHPLLWYIIQVLTLTLLFSLLALDKSVALSEQYYKLAWCLALALLMASPIRGPFTWEFRHRDTPERIYEDPESAAIATAVYPDTMAISLVPLIADKRAFLSKINDENNNLYRYSERWCDSRLAIGAIERLQIVSIERRHQSTVQKRGFIHSLLVYTIKPSLREKQRNV